MDLEIDVQKFGTNNSLKVFFQVAYVSENR